MHSDQIICFFCLLQCFKLWAKASSGWIRSWYWNWYTIVFGIHSRRTIEVYTQRNGQGTNLFHLIKSRIIKKTFEFFFLFQNTLYGVQQNNQLVNTIPYFFTLAGKADVILQQMVSVFLDICKWMLSMSFISCNETSKTTNFVPQTMKNSFKP